MFALVKIVFALATSKRGRKALRQFVAYLGSDEGQRVVAQVRKVATGPEAQRVARQIEHLLRAAAERARARRQPARPGLRGRLLRQSSASSNRSRRVPRSGADLTALAAQGRRKATSAAGRVRQKLR